MNLLLVTEKDDSDESSIMISRAALASSMCASLYASAALDRHNRFCKAALPILPPGLGRAVLLCPFGLGDMMTWSLLIFINSHVYKIKSIIFFDQLQVLTDNI